MALLALSALSSPLRSLPGDKPTQKAFLARSPVRMFTLAESTPPG